MLPARRDLLRRLYLRVHPDIIQNFATTVQCRTNEASFQAMQALLRGPLVGAQRLEFFVTPRGTGQEALRLVQARVRASRLDADLRELVRQCEGGEATSSGASGSGSGGSSSIFGGSGRAPTFSAVPWWRQARGEVPRQRPIASLGGLLERHAVEARERAASASSARDELARRVRSVLDELEVRITRST